MPCQDAESDGTKTTGQQITELIVKRQILGVGDSGFQIRDAFLHGELACLCQHAIGQIHGTNVRNMWREPMSRMTGSCCDIQHLPGGLRPGQVEQQLQALAGRMNLADGVVSNRPAKLFFNLLFVAIFRHLSSLAHGLFGRWQHSKRDGIYRCQRE